MDPKGTGTKILKLIKLAKVLEIPNFKCVCKDELKNIYKTSYPINIIVNLNDSTNNDSGHWCIVFIDDNQKVYYSSYGDEPPLEVINFMKSVDPRQILTSNFQTQQFDETNCGERSMLILYLLNNGMKFEDIILALL